MLSPESFGRGKRPRSGAAHPHAGKSSREPEAPVSPSDLELARLLMESFVKTGRARRSRSDVNKWARHLAAIVELDGHERQRVAVVLRWFARRHTHPFAPRAYAGATIRDRYPAIAAAMARIDPDHGLTVTDRARELGERVWNYGWPVPSLKAEFPALLQRSLDNMASVRNALRSCSAPGSSPESRAIEVLVDFLSQDHSHACDWWHRVHSRVAGWKGWDGNAARYVPSLDNPEWVSMLTNTVHRFAGQPAAEAALVLLGDVPRD